MVDWSQIFTGLLPLLGVLVGGLVTYITQNSAINKKNMQEKEKEILAKKIELLEVYNIILKLDGENQMQEHVGGSLIEFNIIVFKDKMRPVLYSKYHLLHNDIADILRRMDSILTLGMFMNEYQIEHHDQLTDLYNNLLNNIEQHINRYRVTTFFEVSF